MTRLRPARLSDASVLAEIVRLCNAAYEAWAPSGWLPPGRFEDEQVRITRRIEDEAAHTTLAEADAIFGFSDWRKAEAEPDVAELRALYVNPAAWGRGVGRLLLRAAQVALAEEGFERGRLWVPEGNARAIHLYSSEGWSPSGAVRRHERLGLSLVAYELRRSQAPGSGPRG